MQYLVDIQLARQYILDFFPRIKNAFIEVLHRQSDCVELPNTRIDNNDSDMIARLEQHCIPIKITLTKHLMSSGACSSSFITGELPSFKADYQLSFPSQG